MEEKFCHGVGPEPVGGGTSRKVQQNPSGSAQTIPAEAEEAVAALRSGGSVLLWAADCGSKQEVDFQPGTKTGSWPRCERRRTETQPGVDASSEVSGTDRSGEDNTYRSVLDRLLQRQKHKPGRRFKKKTLVKMAKLLVIAKGWDGGGDELTSQRGQCPEGGQHEAVPPTCTGSPDRKRKPEPEPKESGSEAETEHRDIGGPDVSNWTSRRGRRDTETTRVSSAQTSASTESGFTLKDETTTSLVLSHDPELKSSRNPGPRLKRKTRDQAPASSGRTTRSSMRRLRPTAEEPEPGLSREPASCLAGDRVDRIAAPKTRRDVRSPGKKRLPVLRPEQSGLEDASFKPNGDDAAARVWTHGSRTRSDTERTNSNRERRRAAPKDNGAFEVLRGTFKDDEPTVENSRPEGRDRRRKMNAEPPCGSEIKRLHFSFVDTETPGRRKPRKLHVDDGRSRTEDELRSRTRTSSEDAAGSGGAGGSREPEERLTRHLNRPGTKRVTDSFADNQEELIFTKNTPKTENRAARRETNRLVDAAPLKDSAHVTGRRRKGAKRAARTDVQTAPGGRTPETESTLDEMGPPQTQGEAVEATKTVPLDVHSKAETTAGSKTCRERRRMSKSETLTAQDSTDGTRGHDGGALEDKDTCQTPNMRRMRRDALMLKVEDPESPVMDRTVIKTPESSFTVDPVPSLTKTRTRRKRRRKSQQTDKKDVKQPRLCPLEDISCNSSLFDNNLNFQPQSPSEATPSFTSEPETSDGLGQKTSALRCSFCRRSFRHISAFTLHKRIHTGEKPYGCSVCTKRFSKLPQLLLHSKVHGKPSAVRCPCCDEAFRSKTELVLHFRVHLDKAEGSQTEPEDAGRTEPEDEGRMDSSSRSVTTFRCSVCSKEFRRRSTFVTHRRRHGVNGLPVSRSSGAAVVTPGVFKCPVCKQLQRRWCSFVLHLQSHASGRSRRCDACGQRYDRSVGTTRHCSVYCRNSGGEAACRGSPSHIWKESPKESEAPSEPPSRASVPPRREDVDRCPSSGSSPASGHMARPGLHLPRLGGRFLCGRCGRTFTRWNKLWLHRRLHQRGGGAFRCSLCELEFHFLGLYVRHLQEHAARTPHVCPSCPAAFTDEADLKTHVSVCLQQPDGLSCRTCGKRFSVWRNLRNHQLLHEGATSHAWPPCRRSFSCSASFTAPLQTHGKRLRVPRPARVDEPLLFPFRCRKCPGRFSSAELLQAHQVCHYVAGRRPESSPERLAFSGLNVRRVPSDPSRSELPVSNKKHLFRYPHPDRLYVVPVAASEPPAAVTDTEEATEPETSDKPLQLELLITSLIPEKCLSDGSDCQNDAAEHTTCAAEGTTCAAKGTTCAAKGTTCAAEGTTCAVCALIFTDVAALHQHYRDHARGMS